jgi:hypothetical protein
MNRIISRIIIALFFVVPLCGQVVIGPVINLQTPDIAKQFVVFVSCLVVGILTFIKSDPSQKRFINWPLYALLVFLPVTIYCAPPIDLEYGTANLGGSWMWASMVWVVAFWLLYESVVRLVFIRPLWIARSIGWAAIISAVYALIQAAAVDQFQFVQEYSVIGNPAAKNITAFIGNPTYLAVWLVMCLPFLFAYFRWPAWTLTGTAIIFCQSDIGLAGMVIVGLLWGAFRARRGGWLAALVAAGLAALIVSWASWGYLRPKLTDNGRFSVWAQVWEDWRGPVVLMSPDEEMTPDEAKDVQKLNNKTYALTGRGMGSFPIIFGNKYSTQYKTAHNEHLEFLYCIGLIGYALFLAAAGYLFYTAFPLARGDLFYCACYVSLIFSFLAAAGMPVWHNDPTRLYSALMFSLLSFGKK